MPKTARADVNDEKDKIARVLGYADFSAMSTDLVANNDKSFNVSNFGATTVKFGGFEWWAVYAEAYGTYVSLTLWLKTSVNSYTISDGTYGNNTTYASNNYKYSWIRSAINNGQTKTDTDDGDYYGKWPNSTFLSTTPTKYDKDTPSDSGKVVAPTAFTTFASIISNQFVIKGSEYNDYVWLPSIDEVQPNGIWGCTTIQWAGLSFWTRTPVPGSNYTAYYVDANGKLLTNNVYTPHELRPAINVNLTTIDDTEVFIVNPDPTKLVPEPELSTGGTTATETYDGTKKTFTIENVSSTQVTHMIGLGLTKESYDSSKKTLLVSATNAGTYDVTVTLADSSNSVWESGGTADKIITITINKAPLTANITGLPTNWDEGTAQTASVTLTGFQGSDDESSVAYTAYYQKNGSSAVAVAGTGGSFNIPSTLAAGNYDFYVELANDTNYTMDKKPVSFTIDPPPTTDPGDTGGGGTDDDSDDPNNPGGGSGTTDPNDPNNPGGGSGTTDPNDPNNPGGGSGTTDPNDPNNPGGGSGTTDPNDPNNPGGSGTTDPNDPNNPSGSGTTDPNDPNNPGGGSGTTDPNDPNNPGGSGTTDPNDPNNPSGSGTTDPSDPANTDDNDGTNGSGSFGKKILNFLKKSWWWLLIALAAITLLIIIIVVASRRKKNDDEKKAKKEEKAKREEEQIRAIEQQAPVAAASMAMAQPVVQPVVQPIVQPVQQPVQPVVVQQPNIDLSILAEMRADIAEIKAKQSMPQINYVPNYPAPATASAPQPTAAPAYAFAPAMDNGTLARLEAQMNAMQAEQRARYEAEQHAQMAALKARYEAEDHAEVAALRAEQRVDRESRQSVELAAMREQLNGKSAASSPAVTAPSSSGSSIPAEVVVALLQAVNKGGAPVILNTAPAPAQTKPTLPPDAVVTTTTTVDRSKNNSTNFDVDGFYDKYE